MKFQNKSKYYLFLTLLLIFIIFIDIPKVANTFLYLKNGSTLSLNNYKIKFPLGHWAYFGESKIAHVLSGLSIDDYVLGIEVFKKPKNINIVNVLSKCETIEHSKYENNIIKGIIYVCKKSELEIMYFQSNNREIFMRGKDYNSLNLKIITEYELLLDSFSLIE